jgi:hypothetical protein
VALLVLLAAVRIGDAFPDAWPHLGPSDVVTVEPGATAWRQRLAIVDAAPVRNKPSGDVVGASLVVGDHRSTF